MIYIIIGSIIFFACLIFARLQSEKGLKELEKEQIMELVQSSSKGRTVLMIVLMVIIVAFMLISYYTQIDKIWAMIGYFAALIVYYVYAALISLRRVNKLNLPEAYVQRLKTATLVRLSGLAAFVILMCLGLYKNM